MELFEARDTDEHLPLFASHGVNCVPPPSRFEIINEAMNDLKADVITLKNEVNLLREERNDMKRLYNTANDNTTNLLKRVNEAMFLVAL